MHVGTVLSLPGAIFAELLAGHFDFVWIDLEHGALSTRDVQPLAIAARAGGAASLVRLRSADDPALGPSLDAGVDGVVVPRVETAGQAAAVVERLRHPPRGSRGTAARRAAGYGVAGGRPPEPVCLLQIETAGGVEGATAIAGVDGVDALVVGCADLALDLGEPVLESERFAEAVGEVQSAAADARIASGIAGPGDPGLLMRLAGSRSSLLVLGADVRIYAGALSAAFHHLPEEAHVRT
jgi:2-dehydro-3-deoxyglucarate aldolase/4-hydroxy-2-oxoheptanedioate aldolase